MIQGAPVIDKDLYDQDQELTTREAAAVAKLNRRTIVAWINRGFLPATKRPGLKGHYRVLWKDLHQVLHAPAVPKN